MTQFSSDVLHDDIAMSLAQVMAAANERVTAAGVRIKDNLISIAQLPGEETFWRINYGPDDYVSRRGGDFIVDVGAHNAAVKQVIRGQ